MRKRLLSALALAGALLFLATGARAQVQTNVTATVVDPNGIPYAGGTYSVQLIPTGTNPTVNGNSIGGAFNGSLDANGRFNISLWPNASIVPPATTWQFTICSNPGGIAPPLGTGTQCTPPTVVTIAGASQSLSSTLSAVAPKLTNFLSSGGVTSITATAPITVTPSPITGVGDIECPSCNTGTGSVTACTVTGGIAYENGTNNTLTCGSTWTLFNGTILFGDLTGGGGPPYGPTNLIDVVDGRAGTGNPAFAVQSDGSANGAVDLFVNTSASPNHTWELSATGTTAAWNLFGATHGEGIYSDGSGNISLHNVGANPINLPTATGGAGTCWSTNGANPQVTSWIACGSGTIGGSISAGQIAVGSGVNTIGGSANLTYSAGFLQLTSSAGMDITDQSSGGVTLSESGGGTGEVFIRADTASTTGIIVENDGTGGSSGITINNNDAGGGGITIEDTSTAGNGGIFIANTGGAGIVLNAIAGGVLSLESSGGATTLGGKITQYNSVTTAGNGVAAIYGADDHTAEITGNYGPVTLLASGSATGFYLVTIYAEVSTSVGTSTITTSIGYHDDTGAQTQNGVLFSGATAGTIQALTFPVRFVTGTALTYSTSTANSPKYKIFARVQAL